MINKTIEIVKEAGEIIKTGFGKKNIIEYKTNESNLVTEIDKKSEKLILDFIKKEFPAHSVIAEETGSKYGSSEYTWVIDPLDGTTNFAHNIPIFAVSVGIRKRNETVIGIIYDVMRNSIYSAEKGSGAFQNNNKIKVSNNCNLLKSVLVTGFPYNIKENYKDAIKIFGSFLTKTRGIRRLGSAAIDFCYVASGSFDGFWETNLAPWDVCAGMLLVEESGGKVTNFNGKDIDIFSNQFLATNGEVHEEMIKIINE